MYSTEQVRQMCLNGAPRDTSFCLSEVSSDAQHYCAIDFWQTALELTGAGELQASDREFAKGEIARHQALLSVNALPDFSVCGRLRAARDGGGMSLESLASWVGSGNGGSAQSQIQDKINFWQRALECKDALTPTMRGFVERELAKQQAALEALRPRSVLPKHGMAV